MKSWIRWPGLIAFVVIFGGLFVGFYFFAGSFVKGLIEEEGSEALGAKVSVESVKLSLAPLGFSLHGFEAANPDEPMTNAVEFSKASSEIAFWHLLMGQVIVNEVGIDDLQFNTPRDTSGVYISKKTEVEKAEEAAEEESSLVPDFGANLPSASDILAKETLLSETRSKELKGLYEQKKVKLKEIEKSLPDSDKLKSYEKEVKDITSGKITSIEDFRQRKARLSEVKKAIKADQALLDQAKDEYKSSYSELKAKTKELKDSPSEDLQRLKSKYSLDAGGAANVSQLLFGGQSGVWTKETLYWYEKAKPYLETTDEDKAAEQEVERMEGRFVHYGGVAPLPDFLLKQAFIDVSLPGGRLDGVLKDLTHQPEILRKPATLKLKGDQIKGFKSINVDAVFDHIDPKNSVDKANMKIVGAELKDFTISDDDKLPLSLKSSIVNVNADATVKKGVVAMTAVSDFSQSQFASTATSGTAKHIAELLADIRAFNVVLKAQGNLKDVDISVDSSLDKQLKAAFKGKLKTKQKELEAELKTKLEEKMAAELGKHSGSLAEIAKGEGGIDQKKKEIENMLKSKLTDYEAEQKRIAQEKLEAEKQKAREKAEEEKRKAREKAKKEAQDAIKDKLKGLSF